MTNWIALAGFCVALALVPPGGAAADPIADFYKGKTVTLVIGTGVGGSYDLEARLVARFIGAHIPGRPVIVPQNSIGGGGIAAANYLYAVAPPDGTTIAMLPNTLIISQITAVDGAQYDMAKFGWIGSVMPQAHNVMMAWDRSPVRTIEAARRQEITAGATAKGAFVYTMPALLNEFLGTKFKIVAGYTGLNEIYLALEKGEVDSVVATWGSFKVEKPALIRDKRVTVLVQSDPKASDLPDIPTLDALAKNDDDRQAMHLLLAGNRIGRPLATSPALPAERLAALRAAFEETINDPRFRAEAASTQSEIGPIHGAEIAQAIQQVLATPKAVVDRARKILE